jgi:hypothetical protein
LSVSTVPRTVTAVSGSEVRAGNQQGDPVLLLIGLRQEHDYEAGHDLAPASLCLYADKVCDRINLSEFAISALC